MKFRSTTRIGALTTPIFAMLVVCCLPAQLSFAQSAAVTTQHSFRPNASRHDGGEPESSLILGPDGNYYGTTIVGGSLDYGTVFKMTPVGVVTILHSFTYTADGAFPAAALAENSDGSLYGTTSNGGSGNEGTVFRITTTGVLTTVHQFGDGTVSNDGNAPYSGLVLGANGNFYGTTKYGGSIGLGTVFEITTAGQVTILHSFLDGTVGNDGFFPLSSLVLGSDGNFYGTTYDGGSTGEFGTVFDITPNGAVTIIHSFEDGSVINDGANPRTALVEGSDGNYYGTTTLGGVGEGTVFEMTPRGSVTILHWFGDGTVANDGQYPFAGLIQGADGNFYGTTPLGGAYNLGTAFMLTSLKSETVLHSFGHGGIAGKSPFAALFEASDGSFYGTTTEGGDGPRCVGTVYKMVVRE